MVATAVSSRILFKLTVTVVSSRNLFKLIVIAVSSRIQLQNFAMLLSLSDAKSGRGKVPERKGKGVEAVMKEKMGRFRREGIGRLGRSW